jgi:hypothetical protein
MSLYSIARPGTVTTSGATVADTVTGSGIRPRIMEIGIFLGAATASTFSIRRNTANGTRTSPVAFEAEDPGDPALTGITLLDMAIAFSVDPTKATNNLRRIGLPATIGVGAVYTFPRGLVVAASGGLSITNEATNSAVTPVHIVADA